MAIIVTDTGFSNAPEGPDALELTHLRRSDTGGHTVTVPSDTDAIRAVFVPLAMFWRINMPMPVVPVLMRWKSLTNWLSGSRKHNGSPMPIGPSMIIKAA